jgi:hypothetical protein
MISFFWSLFFWIALISVILWLCGIAQLADEIVFTLSAIIFIGKTMHEDGVAEEKIIGVGYCIALFMAITSWTQGHIGIWVPSSVIVIGALAFLAKKGFEKWLDSDEESVCEDKKTQ